MRKRRKRVGRENRIGYKLALQKYKGSYIQLLNNIKDDVEYLQKSWELITAVLETKELQAVAAAVRARVGESFDENLPEGDDDMLEHLVYHIVQGNMDHRKRRVLLSRQLLAEMSASNHPVINTQRIRFLHHLVKHLKLTEVEIKALEALYLISCTRHLHWIKMDPDAFTDYCGLFSLLTGIDEHDVGRLLSPSSKLVSSGIVELCGDHADLPGNVVSSISGNMTIEDFHRECFYRDEKPAFNLSSFDIEAETLEIIKGFLVADEPCHILFYGKPGSGKTELARAVIAAVKKQALVVAPRVENLRIDNGKGHRISRVTYASYFAENKVIVVDEAELLLNTSIYLAFTPNDGGISKSMVNTFFDESRSKIIWIVNDSDRIHESTHRRFHFKVKFDKLSRGQRGKAIDLILKKHGQMTLRHEKFITDLLNDETVTPGILDNAMQGYARIVKSPANLTAEQIIPRLIASHKHDFNDEKGLSAGDNCYRPDILNTSGDTSFVMNAAKAFSASQMEKGGGVNFLLHGLPGTGKTEFVKHVARQTGCDIVFKRGSDLLSMWVGGTEKQIAAAFREAEDRHAILLVDEADTFFQPRESAERSWEVSQTNEFLNQMENHSTMLFCCTNLIDRLDAAAMRRFHFKLEFRAMLQEKRAAFFIDYFKDLIADNPAFTDLEHALRSINALTPGDFRAVLQRLRFKPAGSMPWKELVQELASEGSYKKDGQGKTIGFGR